MKKDPMIRESIDESLCGIRFNAQDKRSVLRAVRSAQPQKKKRLNLRLDLVCAGLMLIVLIAPLTLAKLHAPTVSTVTDTHISNPPPDLPPLPAQTTGTSPSPTPVVTASPSPTPTASPTPTPTPVITAEPTPTPTPVVTAEPTPTPTPVVTAEPTFTPTPAPLPAAKTEPEKQPDCDVSRVIQSTRDLYNELCNTSVFTFDEFTVKTDVTSDDVCIVTMNSIYDNGCSFTARFDMKTGDLIDHSDPEKATMPSAHSSDTAKAWFNKYGPDFWSWPQEARDEYTRRYAFIQDSQSLGLSLTEAEAIAVEAAASYFEDSENVTGYASLSSDQVGQAPQYIVFCYEHPVSVPFESPCVEVHVNPVTGEIEFIRLDFNSDPADGE